MPIAESDLKRMVALLESMSDVIYKYQQHLKPREADKARQARVVLKKIRRNKK